MKKRLHIVLSCTNRKRASLAGHPRLREVAGDVDQRAATWTSWIDSTPRSVETTDLYLGEFWRMGLSLAKTAAGSFSSEVWVLSAGLGLINGRDVACAYGATFGSGHPDSVVGRGQGDGSKAIRSQWWNALAAWPGPSRAGRPRSLSSLISAEPEASMLVCAGPDYIDAIEPDLAAARSMMDSPSRMAVFGSGKARPGFEESWVPVPARLRMAFGGSLASTGPRAARAAMEDYRPGDEFDVRRSRALISSVAASAPAIPAIDRERLTDDTITTWIGNALAENPQLTKSPALRTFRDQGMACEQSRFARLFETVKARGAQ